MGLIFKIPAGGGGGGGGGGGVAASTWTTGGTPLWSVSGNAATPIGTGRSNGPEQLHGPLLPAGQYVDVTLDSGYQARTGLLGVADTYGAWDFVDATAKYATWYWSGTLYTTQLTSAGAAPTNLTSGRYRISSQAGGVIKMAAVSGDGSTITSSVGTMTMTSGFNASNLHVVLFGQGSYLVPGAVVHTVQIGTGGL